MAKTTARGKTRTAADPTSRRPTRSVTARIWLAGAVVAALLAALVALVVYANRGDEGAGVQIDHVHGLGVNPADGVLYVATHNGVFRLPAGGAASRVGEGAQDTMGFTVVGPDHFLASGHPALLQGGPDHLGLIESIDGGVSWRTLSLAGEADFHALQHRHDTIYGYNSITGQLMTSGDGITWDSRSTLELYGFAVSPTDPDLILATTPNGLVRSTDGGRSWNPAGGPPAVLLAWPDTATLWGITATGELHRSADSGAGWSAAGQAPGASAAFAAEGSDLYLAVPEEGIFGSHDAGASWDQLHP